MNETGLANQAAWKNLRRAWIKRALFAAGYVSAGSLLLALFWKPAFAGRWLAIASLLSVYVLFTLLRGLHHNHRFGEDTLFATLGAANDLTLLRGFFTAGLAGFLFSPRPEGMILAWVPGALYVLVGIADGLDGALARRSGRVTRLGAYLDISLDGFGVFIAVALAIQYGQLPAWYILIGLARYFFLLGGWLRKRLGKPVYELDTSVLRRALASSQMVFLGIMLFPLFDPQHTFLAAYFFGLPMLLHFGRDWLVTSGVIVPSKKRFDFNRLARWLPLPLRLVTLMLTAVLVLQGFWPGFPPALIQAPQAVLVALIVVEVGVALALALGVAGRQSAILGLLLLALHQIFFGLIPLHVILAFIYTVIIFLGTGPLSLWQPGESGFIRAIQRSS